MIAVVILYFSLRKQLRKVDFDESALPAGVKPLPKYATKAEREKSAAAFEARRNAGPDTGDDQVAGASELQASRDGVAGTGERPTACAWTCAGWVFPSASAAAAPSGPPGPRPATARLPQE